MTGFDPSPRPPSAPPLLVERRDRVVLLTLNRPERLNAVSLPLYRGLLEALDRIRDEGEVRSVVLTGTGRAFSVGADLRAHLEGRPAGEERRAYVAAAQAAARALQTLPVPVVAAVNGHAVGAGLELALSCDLVVVARDAKLRLPEMALGTFVGGGLTYTLPARVGDPRAREILLLAEFFRGSDAVAWGLANRAVEAEDVLDQALAVAERAAAMAPRSVRLLKRLLERARHEPSEAILEAEGDALLECMGTRDWAEGIAAFHEKRPPRFTGE